MARPRVRAMRFRDREVGLAECWWGTRTAFSGRARWPGDNLPQKLRLAQHPGARYSGEKRFSSLLARSSALGGGRWGTSNEFPWAVCGDMRERGGPQVHTRMIQVLHQQPRWCSDRGRDPKVSVLRLAGGRRGQQARSPKLAVKECVVFRFADFRAHDARF